MKRALALWVFLSCNLAVFSNGASFDASFPGHLTVTSGGGNCGEENPKRWSDTATWGGTLPQPNSSVDIPACELIILDVVTPPLDLLRIEGTLRADPQMNLGVTANSIYIMNGGALEVGTPAQPYTRQITITLTGPRGTHTPRTTGPLADNALDNDGLSRAIRVMNGGALRLFGAVPPLLRTKLNANTNAGATSLTLADSVNWRDGDRIAVAITDFYDPAQRQTEILTLDGDSNGTTLNTTSGLQAFRWGRLQYPTDSGVSLSPGTFTPNDPNTPTVIDERAEIVNLTRRIVIQGADDIDWTTNGFGAHVMIMGLNSVAQARGVEFRRVGQRRAMGRYPWHWHMLSYTAANAQGEGGGQYLGDPAAGNHFLQDSAIWNSQNRAVTIHGTNNVTVDNVYAVDIKGHAFFMEDGSEERNTITRSVAMKVRNPTNGNHLKQHDIDSSFNAFGSSGFWLVNPNNTITRNSASDCEGRGLWNTFADRAFGLSRNVNVRPDFIPILSFDDNVGHSNRGNGIATDLPVGDEQGNLTARRYLEGAPVGDFFMRRNITWKNSASGYQNRVQKAHYLNWTAADNNGRDFQGSTLGGAEMVGTLLVGSSLNNATPFTDPKRVGVASYHHELNFSSITFINYPYDGPTILGNGSFVYGGGIIDLSDLYVYSIGLGNARDPGWKRINAKAGYVTPPPYFDGFPLSTNEPGKFRYWSLPVSKDTHGYWSGHPGWYMVHDNMGDPNNDFFTYGLSSSQPSPDQPGLHFTPDRFFGLESFQVDAPNAASWWGNTQPYKTMRCAQLDGNNNEVGHHLIGPASQSAFFPGFRHFSLHNGGRYRVTWPGEALPTSYLIVWIKNAFRGDDSVVVGLPWPGSVPARGRLDAGVGTNLSEAQRLAGGSTRIFSFNGTSINDVANDASGVTAWQDTANNLVYVKSKGGLNYDNPNFYTGQDDNGLEKAMQIRIWPQ